MIALLAGTYLNLRQIDLRDKISVEQTHHVEIQMTLLQSDLRYIAYILGFLRDQLLEHGGLQYPFAENNFTSDLYSFMRDNELFDQIRFLDHRGMERVRVDHDANGTHIASRDKLQYKGDRNYIKQMQQLPPNTLYISRLDLNVENGVVERPFRPTIRFGLNVAYPGDGEPGLLIINHSASDLLHHFEQVASANAGAPMLLSGDGYWLFHPDRARMWGFMLPERNQMNMATLDPELWQQINAADRGQFDHHGDLITFATATPFAPFQTLHDLSVAGPGSAAHWKVVSRFPADALAAITTPITYRVLLVAVICFLLALMLIIVHLRFQRKKETMLTRIRQLSHALITSRDSERRNIARTLHDEFSQMLTAVQIESELLRQRCIAGDKPGVTEKIDRIDHYLAQLQQIARSVIGDIRLGHIEELGLTGAIEALCAEWRAESNLAIIVNIDIAEARLPISLQQHLFHIVQEGLTNIILHADASHASIDMEIDSATLRLAIEDDGCGFDSAGITHGNGLLGMRERTELLGGSIHIRTKKGGGTRLDFSIPLPIDNAHG